MKRYFSIFFFFLFWFALSAQPKVPKLNAYATDLSGTLTQSQLEALNRGLRNFYEKTSTQIVFLMIPSLEGYPLEMYSYEVVEKNKIGTKGRDNGVLFLVVKNDKKMRIEVGYGLEGALPDALASSIIRNEVAPYFRKGMYYQGVVAGLNAIISAVKGEYVNKEKKNPKEKGSGGFFYYLFLFILFLIFSGFRGGPGALILLGGLGGFGGGRRSGGFGGFGDGGFGGFSGGGGSFGGGGASGGW